MNALLYCNIQLNLKTKANLIQQLGPMVISFIEQKVLGSYLFTLADNYLLV